MSKRALGIGVTFVAWTVVVFLVGWSFGSSGPLLSRRSPDGAGIAFVRAHPSLDPPSQSLWIGRGSYRQAERVARLAEDADWCDEIFWSPDGTRVGFLIRGSRVDVYDAAEKSLLASVELVEPDGYPGSREARWVGFTPDGSGVSFRECLRNRDVCSEYQEVQLRRPA